MYDGHNWKLSIQISFEFLFLNDKKSISKIDAQFDIYFPVITKNFENYSDIIFLSRSVFLDNYF